MRALLVEPGPHFSVADVARGWDSGLTACGVQVAKLNLGDRMGFFTGAHLERNGKMVQAFETEAALHLAAEGIEAACYRWWPDVVIVVSGFFVPPLVYEAMRERGHTIVLIHTESPYEDDRQLARAGFAHVNVLNDPTNIEQFPDRTVYLPHCYDPAIHRPAPADPDMVTEFFFCGTGYPSRVEFFEQVDWRGVHYAFGGNWPHDSYLRDALVHDPAHCLDNTEAVRWYQSTLTSANLYRVEAEHDNHSQGWALGPREVELAATGTWFARQPRGEGDEVFPMLPTFTDPHELGELIRWAIHHPAERDYAARAARAAVADRTFQHNAAELLRLLDRQPVSL